MAVAKGNIGFLRMAEMAVGIIYCAIHVIPFFKHRIVVRSGCLEIIHLCCVRKQSRFRWTLDSIDAYRGQVGGGGEAMIVTVTENYIGGLQFESRHRGV